MKKLLTVFLLAISASLSHGQIFHPLDAPVEVGGQSLLNPWAGGLNAPQWSPVDFNNDGKLDLYIFDRVGFVHLPFLNIGGPGESKYKYAPELAGNFPFVFNFALLRDFDLDGVMDFFASSNDEGEPGLKVYKGKYAGGQLVFEKLLFNGNSPFIPAIGGPFDYLFVNQYDLPALDDLDGDGDLDVLAMSPGFFTTHYYENVAIEMGYTNDTLIFELRDDCWGKYHIFPEIEHLILSANPDSCSFMFTGPKEEEERGGGLHGGGTLATYDMDNDGDKDFFYGDLTSHRIIMGMNGGNKEKAWIVSQDSTFPSYNTPVNIVDFASSFILDLDNDGLKDFMVSPNREIASPDYDVAWFYKNTSSNETPVFALQQTDRMVDDMIDFGTGSNPAVADVNGDGLLDIVVGNSSYWVPVIGDKDARLFLLLNTGNTDAPAFQLVDDNWLNFKLYADLQLAWDYTPTFGDMDSDGDLDLLVGERYGTLFFVENLAGPGMAMSFGPVQPAWKGVDVGQNSAPFVHDINKDGLPDLVVGERNGNINYLPNQGTPGAPVFTPDADDAPNNRSFGNILTRPSNEVTGYSTPVILEFGDTMYLVSGKELGGLERYLINPDSINSGTFEQLDEKLGGHYSGIYSSIAFGYFNNDDFLDAVIGNFRGGLGLFTSPIKNDGTVSTQEKIPAASAVLFPNPAVDRLHIQLENPSVSQHSYRIFNAVGQGLMQGQFAGPAAELDISRLNTGLFFLEIQSGESRLVRRFIKI